MGKCAALAEAIEAGGSSLRDYRQADGEVDLRRKPDNAGSGEGDGADIPLSIALDRVRITEGIALTGFRGQFSPQGGMNGSFTAKVNGVAPVQGTVVPTGIQIVGRSYSDRDVFRAGMAYVVAGVLFYTINAGKWRILHFTLPMFHSSSLAFLLMMKLKQAHLQWKLAILLAVAVVLSIGFCGYAFALWRDYSDGLARRTFRFSLIHLSLLFAALLIDHYLP